MGRSDYSEPHNPGYCPTCYAVIPQGQSTCTRCRKPAHRGGLFSRTVERLLEWALRTGIIKVDGLTFQEGPVVERRVFKSWDELPPDLAARIEQARQSGNTVVECRDGVAGKTETFSSWEEVPEEVKQKIPAEIRQQMRAVLERAMEDAAPGEVGSGEIVVQQATTSKVLDFQINGIRFGG